MYILTKGNRTVCLRSDVPRGPALEKQRRQEDMQANHLLACNERYARGPLSDRFNSDMTELRSLESNMPFPVVQEPKGKDAYSQKANGGRLRDCRYFRFGSIYLHQVWPICVWKDSVHVSEEFRRDASSAYIK